ncbi:MAG: hypothetical protein IPQ09_20565 [Myxococcales bacterium]|nr:hypothetical protein [Myxococcales bacterium]
MRTSGTVARVLGFGLLLGGVACSALSEDEPTGGSQDDALEAQFDKNNVISDEELSTSTMTVGDVQKFLEKTPYGTRSGLASFTEENKTAAQILHAEGARYKVSPIALLARLQLEQGLISKTQASTATTDIAFGCGCPDSPVCGPKYLGFANQAACAAGSLRRSMDKQANGGSTISGWKVGLAKKSQDGVEIVPKNTATAALYTYTPWVGESGGGKTGVGGTSLYFKVLKRFTDAYVIATSGGTVHSDASTPDTGKPNPVPAPDAAPPPPKDAGPVQDGGVCGCTNPAFPICDPSTKQCVNCLADTHCGNGNVCDTALTKCVECTAGKLDNCEASGKGGACLANKTCGCNTDSDCGSATSGRVCGAAKVCQAGCRGASGNRCPTGQVCSSTSSAIGTCGAGTDAGTPDASAADSAPPADDAGTEPPPPPPNPNDPNPPGVDPEEPEGPSATDPDLEGNATPATNTAPPPQRSEGSVGPTGGGAGPDNDLGRSGSSSSSGCSTSASGAGTSSALLLGGLGLAVLAGSRRRRRSA